MTKNVLTDNYYTLFKDQSKLVVLILLQDGKVMSSKVHSHTKPFEFPFCVIMLPIQKYTKTFFLWLTLILIPQEFDLITFMAI